MSKKKDKKKIDYSDVNTVDPPITPMKASGGYEITRVVDVYEVDGPGAWMNWQEATRRHVEAKEKGDTIEPDPEYLNKDGTADKRKKRLPEDWQVEWQ